MYFPSSDGLNVPGFQVPYRLFSFFSLSLSLSWSPAPPSTAQVIPTRTHGPFIDEMRRGVILI